jgi:hypothetical protein
MARPFLLLLLLVIVLEPSKDRAGARASNFIRGRSHLYFGSTRALCAGTVRLDTVVVESEPGSEPFQYDRAWNLPTAAWSTASVTVNRFQCLSKPNYRFRHT